MNDKYILWFKDISKRDIPKAGGKGANLGEMTKVGFPVPPGFVVISQAYFDFLKSGSLSEKLKTELTGLDVYDSKKLKRASERIQTAIISSSVPPKTAEAIREAYHKLSGNHDVHVAVRSSATAEDLPDASFAGQQQTFLNTVGADDVVDAVKKCWASLFTARAIYYRTEKKFDHFKVGIAVPVQKMVKSEVSGVMFTVDPVTSNPGRISIEGAYGLGEYVVLGTVTPDQYIVDKESGEIIEKTITKQIIHLTREGEKKVPVLKRGKQKLADKYIKDLAKIGKKIEDHYKFPQDIEWALEDNRLYIVQTRAITTIKLVKDKIEVDEDKVDEKVLLEGTGASPGVAEGPVTIIKDLDMIGKVKKGDVLVTTMTDPDFVPAMKKAVAIVTDKGGRTSHAAIVSRELGVPCVVGTKHATSMLKNKEIITVDGTSGKVYEGRVSKEEMKVTKLSHTDRKTATKVYVNLAEKDEISNVAGRNVDGVGLLRAEFMIAQIGMHPKAAIEKGKDKVFVESLAEGIGTFCKAFAPRPVVYRATDFKTNEYRNLIGGKKYEAEEENPMIGYRGASRYVTDIDSFNLELKAVKIVKNKMNCRNLVLMIPFVRTVDELKAVKSILVDADLRRSGTFKLWMMVEIPANVILIDEFIDVGLDGISIGSNDLTMLTLGADRDNEKISKDFNELNPAVMWMIETAVTKARKNKITASICGQAPSDYPGMVKKLVEWGATSISVNPDAIEQTRESIYEAERDLLEK